MFTNLTPAPIIAYESNQQAQEILANASKYRVFPAYGKISGPFCDELKQYNPGISLMGVIFMMEVKQPYYA